MSEIRVRFAPSPTGHLHIGGVRTALFNYLYAQNQKGQFLIRIEDTDRERSKPEYEDEILSGLKWLGLNWDEPQTRQSDRLTLYNSTCEKLLQKDLAYPDPEGSAAIYFRVVKKIVKFHDLVHDPIEFDSNLFEDFVIRKSDGMPAFNFACVVDDIDLKISHVIRGDDHITNTARQVLLYEALGVSVPKFAHLPLILNPEGKPLSKREGGGSLNFYIEKGFLPEGLINYLALLGWGPGSNEEYFTKDALIKKFSIKRINKTAACLNLEKLRYINGLHIKKLSKDDFTTEAKVFYKRLIEDHFTIEEDDFIKCALVYKDRIKCFGDLLEDAKYFFEVHLTRDDEMMKKHFTNETKELLKKYFESLKEIQFTSVNDLEKHLRDEAFRLAIEASLLIHPIRLALTGATVSPGIFDVMKLLGKKRTLARLEEVIREKEEAPHEG